MTKPGVLNLLLVILAATLLCLSSTGGSRRIDHPEVPAQSPHEFGTRASPILSNVAPAGPGSVTNTVCLDNKSVHSGEYHCAGAGGLAPEGLGYDPLTRSVYVAESSVLKLSVINGTNFVVTSEIAVGLEPSHVAFDPVDGRIYVTDRAQDRISVVSTQLGRSVGSITEGSAPYGIVADPVSGNLYVSNLWSGSTDIVSPSNGTILANLPVGADPSDEFYDPSSGNVYVAAYGNDSIALIPPGDSPNPTSIPLGSGSEPFDVARDPATGYLYVTDWGVNQVTVLNGSAPWNFIANIPVLVNPSGIAYDPVSGDMYVADSGSDKVSVINDRYLRVAATLDVGRVPLEVAYDPAASSMLVTNGYSDSITVISQPKFNVTFVESGLPPGTTWMVQVNGQTALSTNTSLTFAEFNGSYDYAVADVPGWHELTLPYRGNLTVWGAPLNESATFVSVWYPVTFEAAGLGWGYWTITINGQTLDGGCSSSVGCPLEISGSMNNITALLPNGTYPYALGEVPGFATSNYSGVVTVGGGPAIQLVNWTPVTYSVVFLERGLPAGTGWSAILSYDPVNVSDTAPETQSGASSNLSFDDCPNGTYYFRVNTPVGWTVSPEWGEVVVNGSVRFVTVTYVAMKRPVASTERPPLYVEGLLATLAGSVGLVVYAVWRRRRQPRGRATVKGAHKPRQR